MSTVIKTVSDWLNASGLIGPLLDALVKNCIILALAGCVCVAWRRASAAARHFFWFVALLSLPCLLLLAGLPRSWQRPLWSVSTTFDSGNQILVAWAPARGLQPELSRGQAPQPARETAVTPLGRDRSSRKLPVKARFSTLWVACGVLLWAGGVFAGSVSFFAGQFRLRELSRNARVLCDSPRPESVRSNDWEEVLSEAHAKLGLRRPVVLLESIGHPMPVTWGSWRPVILLPKEANQWPVERRRVVLLHELAHVKRWDCLTQMAARIICQLFWINPLAWLAARRMCVERESACDDLVLGAGWKPSDYASHLVEVARSCALAPQTAAIAMARSSQLEGRVAAIVDAARRRRMSPATLLGVVVIMAGLIFCFGGNGSDISPRETESSARLRAEQFAHLQSFAVAKGKQSWDLAAKAGESITPEYAHFFDAATRGDWQTVTNLYESFKKRHPQYANGTNQPDLALRSAYWSPVLELCLAYDHVANCEPKYTALLVDGITNSIPPGSIYFGGTDPGRGIPTAFSRSHADGDPFFTLTQNALADGSYLKYLQDMYGREIYMPSTEDSQKCFDEYLKDAQRRLRHDLQFTNEPKQVRPGEEIKQVDGTVTVSGQVAVMSINGLLTKLIFDRNPGHEFYIEESFPLDWMYPYLEPHGLIMKINREALAVLPQAVVENDRAYWTKLVSDMLGDWPAEGRSFRELTDFIERIYLRKDLTGFTGDPLFVRNDYAMKLFSKLRSSIAGVYAWRASQPAAAQTDGDQMTREADLAFRQAFALCPYSPEVVFRYVNLLVALHRSDDALLIATTAVKLDPKNRALQALIKDLTKL